MNQFYTKSKLLVLVFLVGFYFSNKAQEGNKNSFPPPTINASACANADFENNNTTGWSLYSGNINYVNLPCYTCANSGGAIDWVVNSASAHAGQCSAGKDIYSNLPVVAPNGGSYSLLLNNANAGGKIMRASYSFVVNGTNSLFTFQYAPVLQSGGHPYNEQPFFHVDVTDVTANTTVPCTAYDVSVPTSGALAGWSQAASDNSVYWKPWTTSLIDLAAVTVGHTVRVNLIVSDCNQGAHFGYTYLDATCGTPQLTFATPNPCAGTTDVVTAPFMTGATYTWAGPGIVSTSGNTATVNASGTYTATISLGSCAFNVTNSITFVASPTIALTNNTFTSCVNAPNTFSVSGATTYTWSPTTNLSGVHSANPVVTPTSAGTVVYSVTGSTGACNSAPLTVTLTTNPIPVVTLTPSSSSACSSTGSVTIGASGTDTYTWTSTAGGGLSGTSGNSVTVTPTSSPATYSVVGTNTVTGCNSNTSTTVITIAPTPTLNLPNSTYTTCLNSPVVFSVSGAASYTWTPTTDLSGANSATPTVTPTTTNTTVYSVTGTSGGCASAAATVTLTVNPLPTVTVVSTSTAVCSGTTATLTASGANTYAWNPATTLSSASGATVVATPTDVVSPTVYTVTGTDANTCVNTATVSITTNPTPTITVSGGGGNSQTVCGGGLANANVNQISFSVTPAGSINWTNNNTAIGLTASGTGDIATYPAPSVTATTTGIITATAVATGSGCPSTTSTQLVYTVTINPIPGVTTATTTPAGCHLSNGTIVGAIGTGGSGNYSYSWDNGVTFGASSSLTDSAGSYQLQVKDNTTGCIFSQTFVLPNVGGPTPPAVTASSLTVCVGSNVTLTVNTPTAGTTYSWTESNGGTGTGTSYTVTNIPSLPNPYTVSVTATASGCVGVAGVTAITVNPLPPPPVLSAGILNPLIECQGVTPATLSLTTTASVTAVWYVGTNTVNIGQTYTPSTATPTTTIYVISDSSTVTGCTSASAGNVLTVTVTIKPAPGPPTLSAGVQNPLIECQNITPATLSLTTTASVTPVWYVGTSTVNVGQTYTPSTATPTTTIYVISDSSTVTGCTSASIGNVLTVTVTINPLPSAPVLSGSATNPLIECKGVTPATLSLTTTPSITPVWYVGTSTVNIGNTYTPSTATPTTTIYVISDSSTVTGCTSASAGNVLTVTVTINPTPTVNVAGAVKDTAKCGKPTGGVSNLSGNNVFGPTAPYHYQWYDATTGLPLAGDTLPSLSGQPAGSYSLQVTDANGCIANTIGGSSTFSVPALAQPTASFSTTPDPAIGPVPLTITFTNQSTNATGYIWSFGDGTGAFVKDTSHVYTGVNTYTVVMVAVNGSCVDTARAVILAEVSTTMIIPNVFSPNGDGVNDEFFIPNTGLTSLNCDIFNRWGQLLHTLTAPHQSWDGRTPNGDKAPDGTYMFLLEAQGVDGKTYKQQGTLTLVR